MLEINTLLSFLSVSALLALTPGPDNIFVLSQSVISGRTAGLAVTLGLCTGLIVHTSAVAFGIAIIFQTSALAFSVLKYVGAAYLVYLAWKAFFNSPEQILNKHSGRANFLRLFTRGIIMNITNPKVSIFFLAFLPQFADPNQGPVLQQILMLGSMFIFITILVFGGVAILAGTLGKFFGKSNKVQRILNRSAGTVFLCLALKLATSER